MDETIDAGVETSELGSELEEGVETETSVSSAEAEDTTDWKAVAEAERERADNLKTALTQKRQLRNSPAPIIEEDDDAPLTRKDLKNLLRDEVVPLVAASKEDTLLNEKISDPAKRNYVKQLLESRIVRTGTSDADILNDIEEALWLADRKKVTKTVEELKRAANNRPQPPSAGSGNEPPIEQKAHKWTAGEAKVLEARALQLKLDPEKFKKDAWENRKRTRTAG